MYKYLLNTDKAKVIYAPREVYLPYGKPALLDCHFRANPPLTNLRWEKDGFLFDPYNVQGVFYRRNGSLYFSKVDETHSGSYTCTPYNELGTEGPSPSITVASDQLFFMPLDYISFRSLTRRNKFEQIVQRPPVFTVTPQHLYIRKLGENLEIPCDAKDGDQSHRPSIVWYKVNLFFRLNFLPFRSIITRGSRATGRLANTVDQQNDYNRWQLDDRQDTRAGQGVVPMRGEQRSRDGGRGHGINGVERPSEGAVQLERQQQQQRCHVDLGAGIRETQDGILGLVI